MPGPVARQLDALDAVQQDLELDAQLQPGHEALGTGALRAEGEVAWGRGVEAVGMGELCGIV